MNTLTLILVALCILGWRLRKNSDRQTEALERLANSRRTTFSKPKKIVIRPAKKGGRP